MEFSELRVYQLAEKLSDQVWEIVAEWDYLSKDTIGKQLIRAADSVGANIAEGCGRGSYQDNRRFVRISRGSLYEVRHWIRRASSRSLLDEEKGKTIHQNLDELTPRLNAYLNSIGTRTSDKKPMTNDK
jgi:four helix bundle protein